MREAPCAGLPPSARRGFPPVPDHRWPGTGWTVHDVLDRGGVMMIGLGGVLAFSGNRS